MSRSLSQNRNRSEGKLLVMHMAQLYFSFIQNYHSKQLAGFIVTGFFTEVFIKAVDVSTPSTLL